MKKTQLIILLILIFQSLSITAQPKNGISLQFQKTDIESILKFYGQVTDQIFIKSDGVRGFLTVTSPGQVTKEEALHILQTALDLKGFTMVQGRGRIVKVLTQEEAVQSNIEVRQGLDLDSIPSGNIMITQVVPLRYVSSQELKAKLSPLISKGGNIISDERKNALVITDNSDNIKRLFKIIQTLDTRSSQVLIEALLLEVTLTSETKLGIEWNYNSDFTKSGHSFNGDLSQRFNVADFITEGFKYSIIRNDQNLSALIHLLSTDKNVKILSTPHIMTLNNQPAFIRVGEEVPVLTQTRNIQGGETIRSFDYKHVAIELEVTPRINMDREIHLQVHPLVKKILGFNPELNAPILASREAQTSVLINDGETVVIGGLMKDDSSKNQSKIPILGDIPIVGALFRKEGTINEKTELLVFITPRVVKTKEEARALTREKEKESSAKNTPYKLDSLHRFTLGKMLYKEKKYEDAIWEWNQVVQDSPDERLKRKAKKWIRKAEKRK